MNILIDFAYHNCIAMQYEDKYIIISNIYDIFRNYTDNFNIFIVSHPGSYTGIRRSLTLSILQLYTNRIKIYYINLLKHLQTFENNVGICIHKHIWYVINNIECVTSINNIPMNLQICNVPLSYNCKIINISIDYLWNKKYEIFTHTNEIINPIYVDSFH